MSGGNDTVSFKAISVVSKFCFAKIGHDLFLDFSFYKGWDIFVTGEIDN